jgi:divalent metal cation (Fe/Co/Zn/Cd) transporter
MHQSKDPTTFMVVLEDAAALVGLVVALLGVYLSHHFQTPYCDGAASMVIGCLLAAVAIFLAYESKGLLVGENADPHIVAKIRTLVEADPGVERIQRILTMHLGPHTILLTLDVQFGMNLTSKDVEATVTRVEKAIRSQYPDIKHIFIEANALKTSNLEEHSP